MKSGGKFLHLKIPSLLAVFHRRFAGLVIRAGAAFGDACRRHFLDDIIYTVGTRFNHARADHVRDRADAYDDLHYYLIRLGPSAFKWIGIPVRTVRRRDGQPLATAPKTVPLVAEINGRNVQLRAADVFPHIHFRPVREREHAHVFAGIQARIVKVPDFGPLIFRIPLAETIAEAEETFLRAGFFLIAPRAADAAIKTIFLDGAQERGDLQAIAADIAFGDHRSAFGNGLIHRADNQFRAELLGAAIAKINQLGKLVAGLHVEQRHGNVSRAKSLFRQAQQTNGILAAREKNRGPLEFTGDLTHHVNRFGFEIFEMIEMV